MARGARRDGGHARAAGERHGDPRCRIRRRTASESPLGDLIQRLALVK